MAGSGSPGYSGDNGPALAASLNYPQGVTTDNNGNLYIADTSNNVIRKVTPGGIISTIAGNGVAGYNGYNGPGTSVELNQPVAVAVDNSGNVFLADTYKQSRAENDSRRYITTIAGTGIFSCNYGNLLPDIGYPSGIVFDETGNLLVSDDGCGTIWKITAAAGAIGKTDLNAVPQALAIDPSGNLYFPESMANIVQALAPSGAVTTVAGNGTRGFAGDNGPALNAEFYSPYGVAVDSTCSVLIADTFNNRIRKVASPLTVTPTGVFLDASGQFGPPLSVTPAPGCAWTSATSAPWIDITSGGGSGPGTLNFSVQANTTGAPRTGALTIGGQSVSVTQRETSKVFTDVTPSAYYFDFAGVMYAAKITDGCSTNPPQYCPDSPTTRAQMAVFLITAIERGNSFTYTSTPYFTDVPASSPYFKFIQKLKDLGITGGCSATTFCPDDPITRAQMAVFVIVSRYGKVPYTYPATPYFTDVPANSPYFPFVQKMAQAGITAGCAPQLFCPANPLTRGQMSVFIVTGLLNELLPPGMPAMVSVVPGSAAPGQSITVTLTGQNTHFAQGATPISTPPGITASNMTVVNATALTVELSVDANFVTGPVSLVALTGTEEAVLPNGFTVQ